MPVPRIDASLIRTDNPSSGSKRGRVLMLPGIGGSTAAAPFWESCLDGNALRAGLNADGWQTVQAGGVPQNSLQQVQMAGQPFGGIQPTYEGGIPTTDPGLLADIANDITRGARLLATHLAHWDHLMAYCYATYGPMPTVVVGMSWGAWATCQVAIARGITPPAPVGAYAHCPPNHMYNLNPGSLGFPILPGWQDQGVYAFTGMDLSVTALNSVKIPTRVTWGTQDAFITGGSGSSAPPADCIAMVANANLATGGLVTGTGIVENHVWSSLDTTDALAWFTGTIDPSFPKVY